MATFGTFVISGFGVYCGTEEIDGILAVRNIRPLEVVIIHQPDQTYEARVAVREADFLVIGQLDGIVLDDGARIEVRPYSRRAPATPITPPPTRRRRPHTPPPAPRHPPARRRRHFN
jgi:hypothetical protein